MSSNPSRSPAIGLLLPPLLHGQRDLAEPVQDHRGLLVDHRRRPTPPVGEEPIVPIGALPQVRLGPAGRRGRVVARQQRSQALAGSEGDAGTPWSATLRELFGMSSLGAGSISSMSRSYAASSSSPSASESSRGMRASGR